MYPKPQKNFFFYLLDENLLNILRGDFDVIFIFGKETFDDVHMALCHYVCRIIVTELLHSRFVRGPMMLSNNRCWPKTCISVEAKVSEVYLGSVVEE